MKKIILPIFFLSLAILFFWAPKAGAQSPDCQKMYDLETYKCLTNSTKCLAECADKARDAMSLTVDGGKVNLECQRNVCDPAKQACDQQAKDNYDVCRFEEKELTPEETNALQKAFDELGEFFSEMILHSVGKRTMVEREAEAMGAREALFGKDWQKMVERKAEITEKIEEEAWRVKVPAREAVIDVPGTADVKRYSWEENSGVVIKSDDWEKIEFKKPVEVGGFTSREVGLPEGGVEVKVRNANPSENKFGVDAGWLGVTVSRTHFWVLKNPDNKLAVVGVYEGEVEVKTRDGKTIKVTPDGDNPGVVVVEQRLSWPKIVLAGGVSAVAIGGIVLFLKRKRSKKKK